MIENFSDARFYGIFLFDCSRVLLTSFDLDTNIFLGCSIGCWPSADPIDSSARLRAFDRSWTFHKAKHDRDEIEEVRRCLRW